MGRSVLTRLSPFVTRLSRADEIKHLRNALLAEFDGLLATTVDDDAGHAHCAVLVLKLRKMRNVVGSACTAGFSEARRWEASTVSGHIVQVSETES